MKGKSFLLSLDPRVIYEILLAFQTPRTESEARARLKKGKNNDTMSQYTGQLLMQGLITYRGYSDRAPKKRRIRPREKLPPPFDKIDSTFMLVYSSDSRVKTHRDFMDSIFNSPTPRYLITDKGKRFLKAFEEFQGLFDLLSYVPDNSPTEQELQEEKMFENIAKQLGLESHRKTKDFQY